MTRLRTERAKQGRWVAPLLGSLLLCVAGVPALHALAQGANPDPARSGDGGVYRRPLGNEPTMLDPARVTDIYSLAVTQQIFDGLVQFDHTLSITPALAQFWKASRDGLTWTFTLRKGVKFHHGREVTADDVVYSFTRILDPRTRSGAADLFLVIRGAAEFRSGKSRQVSGLAALDRYTVQVTLAEATTPFVSLLAVNQAKIVPRDVAEQQGESFGSSPVGTGPFKFVRWERGREIVLAANLDYFDGPPRLPRIVYRIFPGAQVDRIYEEFDKGALEDSTLPSTDYRQAVASPKHVYVKRPMFSLRHYGFNTGTKPLDDKRVRQAMVYAIDREAIVEEDFLGRYTLARGILPPGTQGFNPKLRGYAYDPAKARELLIQAGYPDGRGLPPIAIWSSVKHEGIIREHDRIRKDLSAVGIRAEFQYLTDWPAFSKLMAEKKLPMFLRAWYADVPDPEDFLFKLFYSHSPQNYMGYTNPVVDSLLLQARSAGDAPRRVELYRRVEEMILDDAPILPIWHYTYERLFQPYVRGVEVSGLGDPYIPLRKIWLERPR